MNPENCSSCRPYSVLLPVGFAVPFPSPETRCALTAPFHPYRADIQRARRSVLCGTFPRVAPAGCYPAPYVQGARTFLPGDLSVIAGAAVRPTDDIGMGCRGVQVKGEQRIWFRRGSARSASRANAWVILSWSAFGLLLRSRTGSRVEDDSSATLGVLDRCGAN